MLTIKKKKGKDFKILNITDTHLVTVDWENPVVRDTFVATVDELVSCTQPDLITMSGDIAFAEWTESFKYFGDLMNKYDIPWTICWGNHDHQAGDEQLREYEELFMGYKNFFYEDTRELGFGSNTIAIDNGEKVVHGLVMIDFFNPAEPHVPNDSPDKGKKILFPELIEWYKKQIKLLSDMGCNESTVITHVPIYEYKLAFDKAFNSEYNHNDVGYEESYDEKYWNDGYKDSFGLLYENICYSDMSVGLFDAMKELGSTKNVLVGHDHINNFSINYEGIRLTYSMASSSVGLKRVVGGTLLTINDEGKAHLQHVPLCFKIYAEGRTYTEKIKKM